MSMMRASLLTKVRDTGERLEKLVDFINVLCPIVVRAMEVRGA